MIKKINDVLFKAIKYILTFALLITTLLVFLQIVSRYAIGFSYAEIDEIALHLFAWMISMGVAFAFRAKAHLGITALVSRFTGKLKFIAEVSINIILIMFLLTVFFAGISFAQLGMAQSTSAMYLPLGYIYASLPFGAALCILVFIENLYLLMFHKSTTAQTSQK